jgi:kynurenine formamidase
MESAIGELSNAGRWGPADELGTLNLITPALRLRALSLPRTGAVVALGRMIAAHGPSSTMVARLDEIDGSVVSASDTLTISPHGFELTHLDALGHSILDGRTYNGRDLDRTFADGALVAASIDAAGAGIITRGVLLDIARARGVVHLPAGEPVTAADLDAAEQLAGVGVEPGDAVFVRTGLARRLAGAPDDPGLREGVAPEAIRWLFDRDVAIYSGDCIERLPSGIPGLPMPLHQIGMARMGLWFLDNPDCEALRDACDAHDRSDFAVVILPLRIVGATGSVVNPVAIF